MISGNENKCLHFLKLLKIICDHVVIQKQIKVRNLGCSEIDSLQSKLVMVL